MCIRDVAVFMAVWCLACAPRDTSPPPVDPDASQPVTASAEPSPAQELDDVEDDFDDDDDDDETPADDEGTPADPSENASPQGPFTFKLHNLCKRAVPYAIAPLEGGTAVEKPKTIPAGAVKEITVEPGVGVHVGEGGNYGAAAPKVDGGHVWISSSCTGVGSSNDPAADPAKLDQEYRARIEKMKKAAE